MNTARRIDLGLPRRRRALRQRLGAILDVLDPGRIVDEDSTTAELVGRLAACLEPTDHRQVWLVHAVLAARLPPPDAVLASARRAVLDGAPTVIADALVRALDPSADLAPDANLMTEIPDHVGWPAVEVIERQIILDVGGLADEHRHRAAVPVVGPVARTWDREWSPMLLRWDRRSTALHRLGPSEHAQLHADEPWEPGRPESATVVVPWCCTYLLTEPPLVRNRVRALIGLLEYSGSTGTGLGYDLSAMSASQWNEPGDGGRLTLSLSASRRLRRIVATSEATATELRGWVTSLAGTGLTGPELSVAPLGVDPPPDVGSDPTLTPAPDAEAPVPVVLVVGPHEPVANNETALRALAQLASDGPAFSVEVLDAGGARGAKVAELADRLGEAGPAVKVIASPTSQLRFAAYRRAAVVVAPVLGGGFARTVAEALACSTPVITADHGAGAEATRGGGAILVDPRSATAIAEAVGRVIADPALRALLATDAASAGHRTFSDFAEDAWRQLTVDSATQHVS